MQIVNNLHAFIWKSMSANNCNTYLINGPTRILIDPGHSDLFDHVQEGLVKLGLTLEDIELIICTHAHPDHIEAVQLFKETPALVTLHHKEWQFIKTLDKYMSASIGIRSDTIAPDFFLKEGDISVSSLNLEVFHTPGHSPGSVTLYWPDQKLLFTGDLVFNGGVGRTDLPGGNGSLLKKSIERLAEFDIEWLLPGHGDIVSGARDVKTNFANIKQLWFDHI
ncbi:MAG: Zn-dependent hydrolase [Desulfobacterales bacterium PC51MH44]|nr:MAG: Zn-dependent hydrolase [Desulfobacterales bacterium PC51MH44]